jgi:hypothetical protein
LDNIDPRFPGKSHIPYCLSGFGVIIVFGLTSMAGGLWQITLEHGTSGFSTLALDCSFS